MKLKSVILSERQYGCVACDYVTSNKQHFTKHLTTRKHIVIKTLDQKCKTQTQQLTDQHIPSGETDQPIDPLWCGTNGTNGTKCAVEKCKTYICSAKITVTCACGKKYNTKSGLWKHSQKCDKHANSKNETCETYETYETYETCEKYENGGGTNGGGGTMTTSTFMMNLLQQNQELQKQLLEIAKEGKHVVNNNNNNTTNNNNFNLNVFLNETCKDALNMVDFVNSLHLQLTDLEETGKLGHSDGISRIFVNGLKVLDVNKRPIHCSDLKREVLYIKEDNVWEKDDEKTFITRAINKVEYKNINQIPSWVKAHPECAVSSNKENTKYLKMVIQCTGGTNIDNENNINKIIKNIAKEVVIDKFKPLNI